MMSDKPIQPEYATVLDYVTMRKQEIEARKLEPNNKLRVETEKVALERAKKMLEDNPSPASPLQLDIIKTAIELIRVVKY